MENQKKQTKQQLRRQLINEHLPYEVYAMATMRYYAQLQDLGLIDVVEIIMHVESIDEDEAIGRCMAMLKERQLTQSSFVASCIEALGISPLEEELKNELRAYHKNN